MKMPQQFMYIAVMCLLAQPLVCQHLNLQVPRVENDQCKRGATGFFAANITVDLVVVNTTQTRMLLYKDLGWVTQAKVARTKAEATSGKFLFHIEYDSFPSQREGETEPNIADFAAIEPGASHTTKIALQLAGTFDSSRRGALLHPGRYWIELTINPVPASLWTEQAKIDGIRRKWIERGSLYSQSMTTEPFELTLAGPAGTTPCK